MPKRTRKPKQPRVFVHPESDAIIVAGMAIAAGDEVPPKLVPAAIQEYRRAHLLISEKLYQQEFSRVWNQRFPKEPCPPGFDVEPSTGDSMADGVREV
jgi:hypothetical protein